MYKVSDKRKGEWPITKWWYTRNKGLTIEQTIDKDLNWFLWAVTAFQNVTPAQADYFYRKTGHHLDPKVIQNVEPYEWKKGDPDELYMEICKTQNLNNSNCSLRIYRGEQLELF